MTADRYRDAHAQPPSAVPVMPVDDKPRIALSLSGDTNFLLACARGERDVLRAEVERLKGECDRHVAHITAIRTTLRTECDEIDASEWADDLHLADVIEKHLCRTLHGLLESAESAREAAEKEWDELRSYITGSLPFLEEAWEACFHGEKQKLLSAEERGMGMLLGQFREIAKGVRVLPMDCMTRKDAHELANNATAWAQRMLGNPNALNEDVRDYIGLGQTCADGIKKAHAEILRLRGELQEANHRIRDHSVASNEMVERVARAICKANHSKVDQEWTDQAFERTRAHNIHLARAAIGAMG